MFDKKHNQKVRQLLAEDGIELTFEQLEETRKAAYEKIRQEMRKLGYTVPESDAELLLYIKRLLK